VNKAIIVGYLGKDPEIRNAGSSKVCSFSVATNESWKDKDGNKQEKTEWHNIEFWDRQAEVIHERFKKGDRIIIEGKLETQTWDDKEDGKKRYKTIVRGLHFEFDGGGKREDSGGGGSGGSRGGQSQGRNEDF